MIYVQVTRVKEDVNAIAYEILRRNGISVKFKVKLRYTTGLQQNNEVYYYNPYSFNSKNKQNYSITLKPTSYVQIDFGTEGENNNIFFISENHKNKLIRKLDKQIALLNAYEDGDIDIIKVDQSGTHISNKFPVKEEVRLGVYKVSVNVLIREEKMDVGVQIGINNSYAILTIHDFLDLMTKLAGLNYTNMTMHVLNFIGKPDNLEYNLVDFRPTKIIGTESRELAAPIAGNKSSISDLNINKGKSKTYNNIKW